MHLNSVYVGPWPLNCNSPYVGEVIAHPPPSPPGAATDPGFLSRPSLSIVVLTSSPVPRGQVTGEGRAQATGRRRPRACRPSPHRPSPRRHIFWGCACWPATSAEQNVRCLQKSASRRLEIGKHTRYPAPARAEDVLSDFLAGDAASRARLDVAGIGAVPRGPRDEASLDHRRASPDVAPASARASHQRFRRS